MQNWDAMQPTANYDQHNSWYNNMFAANIKTEPGTFSPTSLHHSHHNQTPATPSTSSQLENYLKQQHHQQHQQQQQHHHHMIPMETMTTMTPSPSNNESSLQHYFDTNAMQQQLIQQQQYQQQFQQAQQAAAQNQVTTTTASAHMPLGFNPLTPPGLPTAVLPSMTHFYNQTNLARNNQQTPSPQSPSGTTHLATPIEVNDKLQSSALTPRNTPPMDITPPKSPKSANGVGSVPQQPIDGQANEKDQDLVSNSSEDMKYMGESEDDESIRMPIYNSHGKMKNYKCRTCGVVAITKVSFWEHVRSHMKPEKILQCPKCPFVTELKHHLEYHIRKHKNIKPFQCDKCSYTCVNKSMLNSHRKSHSSVYQYRCSDCDYATKYCHSFKLHLRKYDHKPGLVLDEEGLPNPSVVIDVYGTRRGPKSKSGTSSSKRHSDRGSTNNQQNDNKPPTSQLSAALQGFPLPQHQMPASPAKSTSSSTSDVPALNIKMHHQKLQPKFTPSNVQTNQSQQHTVSNLLPPLATILQQNRNMAFFPYWNLNLQVLAAQQQAAVLAQLSPRMRESTLQQLQNQRNDCQNNESGNEDDADENENDDDDFDRKSVDSAMDLSQGTPIKEEPQHQQQPQRQHTPGIAINLKLKEETNDTPLLSSVSSSRRKGRVLKLDMLLQAKSASQSPESNKDLCTNSNDQMPRTTASSPLLINNNILTNKNEDNTSSLLSDESMEMAHNTDVMPTATANASPNNQTSANTSASSTASSSGNSSNSSASSTNSTGPLAGTMFECKYCDIYFKDAVLYTIHMGYHSCDDVFKCNMCGERCDGPVGLFVHMARNAHS